MLCGGGVTPSSDGPSMLSSLIAIGLRPILHPKESNVVYRFNPPLVFMTHSSIFSCSARSHGHS
jgi:hypothetical protein